MNNMLNDNWEIVTKEVGTGITDTISHIINTMASGLLNKVPYKYIFLP